MEELHLRRNPRIRYWRKADMRSFAAGKPTALVLDVGHANSSTVPVVDGYALRAGTSLPLSPY